MISIIDVYDYSDTSEEEVSAILNTCNESPIEACAMTLQASNDPQLSRELLQHYHERLEEIEKNEDSDGSRKMHDAIEHFTATHHYI